MVEADYQDFLARHEESRKKVQQASRESVHDVSRLVSRCEAVTVLSFDRLVRQAGGIPKGDLLTANAVIAQSMILMPTIWSDIEQGLYQAAAAKLKTYTESVARVLELLDGSAKDGYNPTIKRSLINFSESQRMLNQVAHPSHAETLYNLTLEVGERSTGPAAYPRFIEAAYRNFSCLYISDLLLHSDGMLKVGTRMVAHWNEGTTNSAQWDSAMAAPKAALSEVMRECIDAGVLSLKQDKQA